MSLISADLWGSKILGLASAESTNNFFFIHSGCSTFQKILRDYIYLHLFLLLRAFQRPSVSVNFLNNIVLSIARGIFIFIFYINYSSLFCNFTAMSLLLNKHAFYKYYENENSQ